MTFSNCTTGFWQSQLPSERVKCEFSYLHVSTSMSAWSVILISCDRMRSTQFSIPLESKVIGSKEYDERVELDVFDYGRFFIVMFRESFSICLAAARFHTCSKPSATAQNVYRPSSILSLPHNIYFRISCLISFKRPPLHTICTNAQFSMVSTLAALYFGTRNITLVHWSHQLRTALQKLFKTLVLLK